jgi:hypothetical protein
MVQSNLTTLARVRAAAPSGQTVPSRSAPVA